ncbi:MAG TPA: histidine kinase dimerization/phosphoacceptor domain -containing protein [Flavobacterium sp.]|uniref:tetratricopeptide repeat-containing sensor histidine kinase n=1 Tax=Flavobacterium sp. TaxID=239 RepID=UPI002C6F2422|nr:histidine kinase dimerization/phosphoacceptor domain -containing protein [Flavobacterium sp.]HSD13029.1 histidine kinase dimerization/phosphoacceptor domain -containing protein [Flavobacterium sp.]
MHLYLKETDSCINAFEYNSAFKYINTVLSYAQGANDVNTEIFCNLKLVELYRHAELYKKAENCLQKTSNLIAINQKTVSQNNVMSFYNQKAALFSEYYDIPDSTMYYSQKVLSLSKGQKKSQLIFSSLMEIGLVYDNKNNFQSAVNYYQKAYQLAKETGKKKESCEALVSIAKVFLKMKDYKKALEKCDEGFAILNETDFYQKTLFYNIKYGVYEKIGNKDAAFENLKLQLKYTDLYQAKSARDKLSEANKRYAFLERDRQIFKREQNIKEVKQNQLLLMAIILLFASGFLFLIYYSKKIKIVNKQLDVYSKENAFLLNEANHRINNNLQLIIVLLSEELEKVSNSDSDNTAVQKILSKVESISTLHRHLYQSKDKKTVDIQEYLNEIVANFADIFHEKEIVLNHNLKKINLSIDLAMYLGLLTTELFLNTIKHAFDPKQIKLIALHVADNENQLYFNYTDNGKMAEGKIIHPNLVIKICKQIKATFRIESKSGFEITVLKTLTSKEDE